MPLRTNKSPAKIPRNKRVGRPSGKPFENRAALDAAYVEAVSYEAKARKRRHRRHVVVLGILLACVAAVLALLINQQAIMDWWALRHYQAPAAISSLANQDAMTDYATKVFYVNHPAIETGANFATPCPNDGGEQTIVLGCYHSDQRGIYVLGVSDPLLNGVEQVTAAHEMLHAAYDRLSPSERKKVDAMLEDYYQHDLHDQRLLDTIAAYKKTEPKDVVNEMHSIFGTEVTTLPANLEQYYQRYFTDRHQVAALAAKYQNEFTSRQNTIAQDDTRLTAMKLQITDQETALRVKLSGINSQQANLLALRSSNVGAYNSAVPGYNRQVDAYNSGVQQLHQLIDQYNKLVASRNAVALEEDQLVKELSSNTSTLNQ